MYYNIHILVFFLINLFGFSNTDTANLQNNLPVNNLFTDSVKESEEASNKAFTGPNDTVFKIAFRDLALAREKQDRSEEVRLLQIISSQYQNLANYQKALDYALKSLKLSEELYSETGNNNKEKKESYHQVIASLLLRIATIHLDINDNEKSFHYCRNALKIYKEQENDIGIANSLNNLAVCYLDNNEYNKALECLNRALDIYKSKEEWKKIPTVQNNIAQIYAVHYKDYDKAMDVFIEALKASKKADNMHLYLLIEGNIGELYLDKKEYDKALVYVNKNLGKSQEMKLAKNILLNYERLYRIFYMKNDLESSYKYLKMYTDLKDSIFNEEKVMKISEIQAGYEMEKYEKEMKMKTMELKVKNLELNMKHEQTSRLNIILISGIIFVLVLSLLFYLLIRYRELKKRNILQHDLDRYMLLALNKQMNPHFISNSLNSLHCSILENNERATSKYLSKFSRLMRMTLENSRQRFIKLKDEIRALELYLDLESLRFKEDFEYEILTDNSIFDVMIPAFLLQPFVENAVWHGLKHKEEKGRVIIEFNKVMKADREVLICKIEDNGIGRKKAMEIKKHDEQSSVSLGTKITEKRIDLINKLYNMNINVKYTDMEDGSGNATGTRVEVIIPVIEDVV